MSRLIALSYRTPMLDLLALARHSFVPLSLFSQHPFQTHKNKRPNGFRIAVRNDT